MITRRPSLVSLMLLVAPCRGFVVPLGASPNCKRRPTRLIVCDGSSDDNEQDLFDYFDPLRSPHDYPNGISPDNKPQESRNEDKEADGPKMPMGLDLFASEFPSAFATPPDLDRERNEPAASLGEGIKKFSSSETSSSSQDKGEEEVDLFDVFDPTLSPHCYPNGIPSTKKKKQSKVGILLMDHGSRNEASNQRLHDLARLYQQSLASTSSDSVIVKAAHMEIASPSIPEVLEVMVNEGVQEIICHPYFLSPGRHVKEDIPEIVEGAIKDLNIQIPVITTKPVGSNTDLMINAIHGLVEKSSPTLNQNTSRRKLGF